MYTRLRAARTTAFLYSRGFAVAMGREFYDAMSDDPEMGVPFAECEEMCYFFAHLSHEQFGHFPDTGARQSTRRRRSTRPT